MSNQSPPRALLTLDTTTAVLRHHRLVNNLQRIQNSLDVVLESAQTPRKRPDVPNLDLKL